jgi:DNA (cytosine-5)-methyltransferase 1
VKVVDLFSGVGGFSLGFQQAGFEIAAAIEINLIHAQTHHQNFPNCQTINKSVTNVTGEEITKSEVRSQKSEVDVVIGGAPCQGFSSIGKQDLADPRNLLPWEFLRLVNELQPRYFVFENVRGLTSPKFQPVLNKLIEDFEVIGYQIRKPYLVLNAADYGVPQNRHRLFLLGARQGDRLPNYPLPTGKVTVRTAIADLPDPEQYLDFLEGDKLTLSNRILTGCSLTNHAPEIRERFQKAPQGKIEPISRFFKLHPDGVSNTLRAGTDSKRGSFTAPRPIHYEYPRCVTVRELARLQGFPDDFQFHPTIWYGAMQIGNSVPPPLAKAIASCLVN